MFMMPSTSVRPAAIRNSITPSWSPFSNCSKTRARVIKKGAAAPLEKSILERALFQLAFLMVGVLVLRERLLHDFHGDAVLVVGLDGLQQVEVLDRVVVVVELELAADRVVVRLVHCRRERLGVFQVAFGGAHRRVDEQDRVVALRAIVR